MAGHSRVELLQAICEKLGLDRRHSGLDEFLAIVDSRNESCGSLPSSREVYILLSLLNIKKNNQWLGPY